MIRRPPRSTPLYSSAASDVYKRQVQHLTPQAGAPGPPAAVFAHLPSNVQNFLARVRELQAGGQATVQSIVVDHHTAAQHHGRFPVNIHPMRRSAWADAPQAESFFLPGDGEPLKQQDVVTDTASAALQPSEAVCVFQQQPQSNALGLASVSNSSSMIEPEPLPSAEAATRPTVSALTCLLYTSPSPRDQRGSRMPSSA